MGQRVVHPRAVGATGLKLYIITSLGAIWAFRHGILSISPDDRLLTRDERYQISYEISVHHYFFPSHLIHSIPFHYYQTKLYHPQSIVAKLAPFPPPPLLSSSLDCYFTQKSSQSQSQLFPLQNVLSKKGKDGEMEGIRWREGGGNPLAPKRH